MPRLHTWISNEALDNKFCKQWWLTFTLNQVKVELLQCPHCDLFNIVVHQEIHQWCSHMLTGRHARSFGNLFLSLKRTILSNSIYMCKLITNHWDQYTLCGSLLKGKKKKKNPHTYEYCHSSWAFWYGFKDKLVSKNISPIKIIIPNAKTTK